MLAGQHVGKCSLSAFWWSFCFGFSSFLNLSGLFLSPIVHPSVSVIHPLVQMHQTSDVPASLSALFLLNVSVTADSPLRRTACCCTSSSPGKHCQGTTRSFYTADSSSVQPAERCLHNQYHGSARAQVVMGRLCFKRHFFPSTTI